MAYIKNTWVDQEGQVRYRETQDGDFKILTPNYEQVTEIGTPVNADNMNHIEDGIVGNDAAITTINSKIPSNATSSNKMVTQSDLDTKADVDLSNINASQTAKETIIDWGMPDYSRATTITYNSGDEIGFDGYLAITGYWQNKDTSASLYIDGCLVMRQSSANDNGYSQSNHNSVFVNVSSTDVITWQKYSKSNLTFYSIPFKGVN